MLNKRQIEALAGELHAYGSWDYLDVIGVIRSRYAHLNLTEAEISTVAHRAGDISIETQVKASREYILAFGERASQSKEQEG